MITSERIDGWIKEPHQLREISATALKQWAEDYPYFTIAQLCLFLKQDERQRFAAQHPFQNVNPVLLHDMQSGYHYMPAEEESLAAEALPYTETETADATEQVVEVAVSEVEEQAETELAIPPASADDYFLQQGIKIPTDLPDTEAFRHKEMSHEEQEAAEREQALLVMMSFSEWLGYINTKNKKEKEEEAEQKALKALWQQQKLAAAIEEESDEIPEKVFEMAVNSIAQENSLVSESLANVYALQGKREKAIEMYRKLILQNPEKNAYFAGKIDKLLKEN